MTDQSHERTVMLSLISEQAIPNVMAALLVEPRPTTMICLLPKDRESPGKPDREFERIGSGIKAAFDALVESTQGEIDLHVQRLGPVSPYNFEEVRGACERIRMESLAQGYTVVYNVTGGTKLMALAALRDAEEGNCRAVYIDTEFRRLVEVSPEPGKREFIEERLRPLDVPHYLAAYGLGQEVKGRQDIPKCFREAVRLLALNPEPGTAVLRHILAQQGQQDEPYNLSLVGLDLDARHVLEQAVDWLGDDRAAISGNTLELLVDDDMYDFWWNRRWLEWYVFDVLEKMSRSADERRYNPPWCDVRFAWEADYARAMEEILFVEDESGQRIRLPLNELDIAAVRCGRLLVCECKTGGNALQSEHFYKLSVVGRRLGTFADKVFVTDVPGLANPACRDASTRRQALRALILDVAVVGLEELPVLVDVLADPDGRLRQQKHWFGLR